MRYNFCTYFDSNYLARGLALYHSLKKHCQDFRLWVLCMDEDSYAALSRMKLSGMELIALKDFEKGDSGLEKARKDRIRIEYYFTCTPSLVLFILNSFSDVDLITYIDADLYFFADPRPLFEEMRDNSIAIIPHRFSPQNKWNLIFGIYNVGWLSFRRDENGLKCLMRWRELCNEWCYERVEDNKFADQKYLDNWPGDFKGVAVLETKGADVAPWNVTNYKLCAAKDNVTVDGDTLIFFHFHAFRHLFWRVYTTGLSIYKARPDKVIRDYIYKPYLGVLLEADKGLSEMWGKRLCARNIRIQRSSSFLKRFCQTIKRPLDIIFKIIIYGDFIVA